MHAVLYLRTFLQSGTLSPFLLVLGAKFLCWKRSLRLCTPSFLMSRPLAVLFR
jgi:hypothetical protein